jgi:hypothetical protein
MRCLLLERQQAACGVVIIGAAPPSAGWPGASRWLDLPPCGDLAVLRTLAQLGWFIAQELANSLWAYATMGRPPAAALQARIDEHVARTLEAKRYCSCSSSGDLLATARGRRAAQALTRSGKPINCTRGGARWPGSHTV